MTQVAPILKTAPAPREIDIAQAMRWVKATHGKGLLAQSREILALRYSSQRLSPREYYLYGLFRDGIAPEERAGFLSEGAVARLNQKLAPMHRESQHGLMFNKALMGLFLDRAGFPTPPILALYSPLFEVPAIPRLKDAESIADFLAEGSALPCFGKPAASSMALGAVSIEAAEDGGDRLRLADGRLVATRALAEEIARAFPKGYIFQPTIRQHPDIEAVNGRAVGVLRVGTLRTREGPEVLYACLRMPPKGATNDGVTGKPNTIGLVDLATARIVRAQDLRRLATTAATEAPATGKALAEVEVPYLQEALEIARRAQAAFPAHGTLGLDIALGREGPLVNEINARPYHYMYQRASARGLMNPEFRPRIEEAAAVSQEWAPESRRGGIRARLAR